MKVAIVIQRYGSDILGGAEHLSSVAASTLGENCEITVLTTTAKDHLSWAPHYKAGEEFIDGIRVLRFPVDTIRDDYFHSLHSIFLNNISLNDFLSLPQNQKEQWLRFVKRVPLALEEEMIKAQGPLSSALLSHLEQHQDEYDRIIFFTYLYATTYFGLLALRDKSKAFIYPTLHDEPLAYLKIWKRYKECKLLFSTQEEYELAEKLWGTINGCVVHYGLEDRYTAKDSAKDTVPSSTVPYILYAGRIEHAKGINTLMEHFLQYRAVSQVPFQLKLIGRLGMEINYTVRDGIELLGFVSDEEKDRLISGALALVVPSPNESLSIVLLEAFMMGTPVIVNGQCKVLLGHVEKSGGGFAYFSYPDFEKALNTLMQSSERSEYAQKGREYYLAHYELKRYQKALYDALVDGPCKTEQAEEER